MRWQNNYRISLRRTRFGPRHDRLPRATRTDASMPNAAKHSLRAAAGVLLRAQPSPSPWPGSVA